MWLLALTTWIGRPIFTLTVAGLNLSPHRDGTFIFAEPEVITISDQVGDKIAMKLNHLNLTVTDPVATQEFLTKYFGLKPRGKGNHNMAFLSDDNGIVLSLMNPKVGRESEVKYPATFHVGFIQESEQAVDEINQRLKADGLD